MADRLISRSAALDQEIQTFFRDHKFPLDQGLRCLNIDKEPPLVVAARLGLLPIATKLVQAGADVNQRDTIAGPTGGSTPVIKASQYGQDAIVGFLLTQHAAVDSVDNQGATALYRAAQNGHAGIVRQLIEAGANLHITCNDVPPILIALVGKHAEVLRVLTMGGAFLKNKILEKASAVDFVFSESSVLVTAKKITPEHHKIVIALLFEYGMACINNLHRTHSEREDINHLLRGELKSLSADYKVQIFILDKMADEIIKKYWEQIDKVTKYKQEFAQHFTSVAAFIEYLTKLNDTDLTPVHVAITQEDPIFIQAMLEFCKEKQIPSAEIINKPGQNGRTALMYAAIHNRMDIAELLLIAGANPNLEDCNSLTALLIAAGKGYFNLIPLLRKYGASLFCIDVGSMTAFDYAWQCEDKTMLSYLLMVKDSVDGFNVIHMVAASKWAKLKEQTTESYNALLGTIARVQNGLSPAGPQLPGDAERVKILISQKDRHNRNPICYAFFSANFCFIEHLVSIGAEMPDMRQLKEFIGAPPLCAAMYNTCSVSFIKLLLQQPFIDVNEPNPQDGNTALHHLMSYTEPSMIKEIAELLLSRPGNPINLQPLNKAGLMPENISQEKWGIIMLAKARALAAPAVATQQQMSTGVVAVGGAKKLVLH